jgi:tetratricopeptide (TPR) repeat protein
MAPMIFLNLSVLALRQCVGGAVQAVSSVAAGDAAVRFLMQRFTDHSQKLTGALQTANQRAWKALEVALGGETLWERCLARREDVALRQQLRAFLDQSPFVKSSAEHAPIFRQALQELRAARSRGLLTGGTLAPEELARRAGAFARFTDPQALVDAEWQVIQDCAGELRESSPKLFQVLTARSRSGRSSSLLTIAVDYYFRREVETDQQLFQGLAFAKLKVLHEAQEKAFAGMTEVLRRQGERVEKLLADVVELIEAIDRTTKDTNDRVKALEQQIQKLLEQLQLQNREVRPSDSLSVRSEAEQKRVREVVGEYRHLPENIRRLRPDLLNEVGKLEVAAGEMEDAQKDFQQAAEGFSGLKAQAEAHHNTYRAALERQQWADALTALQEAVKLDPERFAPFPMQQYPPQRILGAGGFGVVFLCQHRHLDRPLVVKSLLTTELDRDISDVFAEARALEDLDHPAIIRLKDCDFADAARTRPYLVMDYFDGKDLADHVSSQGRLSPEDLLEIARPVAEALQAAHAKGILHRDVKAGNLLVRREGERWRVKLIDFGLALRPTALEGQISTQQPQARTTTGRSIAGTLHYAAPEQMGQMPGVPVGTYSDVFGFGKTLYYALLGTPDPDDVEKDGLPDRWRKLLRVCTGRKLENRLPDFAAVLTSLSTIAIEPGPETVAPKLIDAGSVTGTEDDDAVRPPDQAPTGQTTPGAGAEGPKEGSDEETGQTESKAKSAAEHLADGNIRLAEGKTGRAVQAYSRALKLDSRMVEAYRKRARAYREAGDLDHAIADMGKVIGLVPNEPGGYVDRASLYEERGSMDKAMNDCMKAVQVDNQSVLAYTARGKAYHARGVHDLALADFNEALRLDPSYLDALHARGNCFESLEQLEPALKDFNEGQRLASGDVRFRIGRGRILTATDQTDQAITECTEVLRLDPRSAEAHFVRGLAYAMKGNDEQAVSDFAQAIKLDKHRPEAFHQRALAYQRLSKFRLALSDFDKAIDLDPRNPLLHLDRGETNTKRGEYREAIKDYTQVIRIDKDNDEGYFRRGTAYFDSEQYGWAAKDYTRVLELNPQCVEAYEYRAWSYYAKDLLDEAFRDTDEALRLDPSLADAFRCRGLIRVQNEEFESAIGDASEAIRLDPMEVGNWCLRGAAYLGTGELDRAIADLTEAIALDDNCAEAFDLRGKAYERKGDLVNAQADRARFGKPSSRTKRDSFSVSLADLVHAGLLRAGDKLFMTWGPRGGEKRVFEGTIAASGEIELLGKRFTSPSNAAVYALQSAGSDRPTANGWAEWTTGDGEPLSKLRERLLTSPEH